MPALIACARHMPANSEAPPFIRISLAQPGGG